MTGMRTLRRDPRSLDAPNMNRMVAVTDPPPIRFKGMLRARFPLAVALLAATIVIPATAASAAGGSSSDPTGVTQQLTGQTQSGTNSGSASSSDAGSSNQSTGTSSSQGGASGTDTTTSGNNNSPSLPDLSGSDTSSNPLAPLTDIVNQIQNSGSSGSQQQPDVAGALQTFGTCLQNAGSSEKPFEAGQLCVENLVEALTNDPRAHCLSDNDFTLQFIIDRLESGQPPSQDDLTEFQDHLTGLLACLSSASPTPSATSGGGGADTAAPEPTATSEEAPAAVAVTGNPDFTG